MISKLLPHVFSHRFQTMHDPSRISQVPTQSDGPYSRRAVLFGAGAHASRARDARRPSRSRDSRRADAMVRFPLRRRVASPAPRAHAPRRARRCPPIAAAAVRRPFSIRDRVGAVEAPVDAHRRAIEARFVLGGRRTSRSARSRVRNAIRETRRVPNASADTRVLPRSPDFSFRRSRSAFIIPRIVISLIFP
jgi:hypothetical protein